jgi:hypothetical protein
VATRFINKQSGKFMDQQKEQGTPVGAPGQQIQVKIPDDVLKGVYANMVQVGHTPEEFVLDFMNVIGVAGIVTARVMLSPGHTKRMVAAMQDNLKKYEEQFGTIKGAAGQTVPTTTSSSDHKFGFDTASAK